MASVQPPGSDLLDLLYQSLGTRPALSPIRQQF